MVFLTELFLLGILFVQADGKTGLNKRTQHRLRNAEQRLDTIMADIAEFRLEIHDIWNAFDTFNRTLRKTEDSPQEIPASERKSSEIDERQIKKIYMALQSEKHFVREALAKVTKDIKHFQSDTVLSFSQLNEREKEKEKKITNTMSNTVHDFKTQVRDLHTNILSFFTKTDQQLNNLSMKFAMKVNILENDLSKCHQLEDENRKCESFISDKDADIKELKSRLQEVNKMNIQLQETIVYLQEDCPVGWHRNKRSCYFTSTFETTWNGAVNWCKQNGGHLVEYEDREELKYVVAMVKFLSKWSTSIWTGFWTGSDDVGHEGEWKWSHSGQSLTFKNWKPKQPDNGSGTEHCMVTLVNVNGQWNDEQCYMSYKFVCKKLL